MELLIAIIFGLVTGAIASNKNRSPLFWFFMGAIFTFVGLAVIFFLPAKQPHYVNYEVNEEERYIYCQNCGNSIVINEPGYWTCPHCQHTFEYKGSMANNHYYEDTLAPTTELLVYLFAKVAKADGVVTTQEIHRVDEIIKEVIQPTEEQYKQIRSSFNEAKNTSSGYQEITQQLYTYIHNNQPLMRDIVILLFEIATVDAQLHPEQERIISFVANRFNLAYEYQNIYSQYVDDLEQYYKILGCASTDSVDAIKRKYRELVRKYHPDRFASQNLSPEEMKKVNTRFQDIQKAYEKVMEAKSA